MPKGRWPGRNWTPELLAQLDELLDQGLSDDAIGKKLGRTATAINIARKRHGLSSRTQRNYSCRTLGSLMGVDAKCVAWWIENKWLRGRRGQRRAASRQWVIFEDDLMRFLERREYWHLWEPGRLKDRDLRDWAQEQRRERFLTQTEVAQRFAVAQRTVGAWLDRGQLAFVRRGRGNRMIPESALKGWTPPYDRPKTGMVHQKWTEFEDAVIRRGRAAGEPYGAIAKRLNRSLQGVANRWHRLSRVHDPAAEVIDLGVAS